jgi:enamine deaminase RidA (YjgF/YER057c/UK114 family)
MLSYCLGYVFILRVNSEVISATIFLTDMANLADFNSVWDEFFPMGYAPSRCCVKVIH